MYEQVEMFPEVAGHGPGAVLDTGGDRPNVDSTLKRERYGFRQHPGEGADDAERGIEDLAERDSLPF